MRFALVVTTALLNHLSANAQDSWVEAGLPGNPLNFQQVYADSASGIYYAGVVGDPEANTLMRYANGNWAALGPLDGMIRSVVVYHDTLFVGGSFDYQQAPPVSAKCVKWWSGSAWETFGEFPQYSEVRMLKVIDDALYATGAFVCGDSAYCHGVMRWNGETWSPYASFTNTLSNASILVTDIVAYDGTLVAIGNIEFDEGRGIAYLEGDQWQLLGPGILGGMAGAHVLATYQGDLYVGGQIPLSAGNPGQEIMRWSGSSFEGMGLGLQVALGNYTSFCDVQALVVHDGILFVGGGCNFAGGLESRGVAAWDGFGWCSVPGDITSAGGSIFGMDFYQDTLFAATGWIVEGDSVDQAAKFIGESYTGMCEDVWVAETAESTGFTCTVLPAHIEIDGLAAGSHAITLRDSAGRTIAVAQVTSSDARVAHMPLPFIAEGMYLLSAVGHSVRLFIGR